MINKFNVPDPCSESWKGMLPQDNGRYCGSCQKVVIDFTGKTNEEIIDYISANSGKRVCGTFRKSQLPAPAPKSSDRMIRFLAAALLVFGMSLFSCTTAEQKIPEEIPESHVITGMMIAPPDSVPGTQEIILMPPVETLKWTPPVSKAIPQKRDENYDDFIEREKHLGEDRTTGEPIIEPPPPPSVIDGAELRQPEPVVGMIAEQMPRFPDGTQAMLGYIQDNIHYPQAARDVAVSGTVYVNFIVRKDGSIDHVKVLRGIGMGCDEEAMRVVKAMPKWEPGMNNGVPVDVQFNLPIKFKLQ